MKRAWISSVGLVVAFFVFPGGAQAAVSLDPTFGSDGKVITSFGSNAYVASIARQTDGKTVAVGRSTGSNLDWRVARYNTDGTLDATFGTGGTITKDFGGDDFLNAVAIQDDGKIVVGGQGTPGNERDWAIARYNTDGTLDTSFGGTGVFITDIRGNFHEYIEDIVLQPDGKIVATGSSFVVSTVRYNTDGTLDTSFGNGGKALTDIGGLSGANEVALQADGKLVLFGTYNGEPPDKAFILRYDANGSLDPTFGSGGVTRTRMGGHDTPGGLVIQPDGKPVVAGITQQNGSNDTFITRYTTGGALDPTFGGDGIVITSFASGNDGANALVLQPDSKILLVGNDEQDSAVRRLNSDGSLDITFGSGGSLVLNLSTDANTLSAIVLQTDGKIVVGGSATTDGVSDWALARLTDAPIINESTFDASGDTYVKSGLDNRNTGAGVFMRIRSDGDNRALVRFDQTAMQAAIGSGAVLSARLRLTITDNGNNWGPTGRTVDVHRLLAEWAEGNGTEAERGTGSGATWNCATDSNIANQAKDCGGFTAWEMGEPNNPSVHPWEQTPTGTQTVSNGQTGVVEYNVTADVIAFLNSTSNNHGWILKKTNEGLAGSVNFGTRESLYVAQLVVTYQP